MLILRRIPYWAVLALLIYMPFHVFLAQSLSLATGGLEAWKIAKDIILVVATLFTICLVFQQRLTDRLFYWLLGLSAAYLGLHLLLWLLHPNIYQDSALLGTLYNLRLFGFAVLGYGARLLNPSKFVFSSVLKVIIGVSTVVALLGLLQFVLPKDLLGHFGYSLDRGVRPAFFIDDNPDLPRIMSTLREPNALGAYLILPFTAVTVWLLKAQVNRQRLYLSALLIVHGLAIALTFSRSAWLGTIVAAGLVVWWRFSTPFVRFMKRYWWVGVALLAALVITGVTLRNNQFVQSYLTHSTPEAVQDLDSNDYHWLLVRKGLEGIAAQPGGHGPGTAGIVSIQNPNGAFLTENYFVQIGYEVGIVGLGVFVATIVLLYRALYRRRDDVGVTLLAALWAYVLINMFLHSWSNEAVAAQWWLLAGLATATIKKQ